MVRTQEMSRNRCIEQEGLEPMGAALCMAWFQCCALSAFMIRSIRFSAMSKH
jgi:hypothetical protein